MDFSEIKKKYSWVGFSFFLFGLTMEGAAVLLRILLKNVDDRILDNSWVVFILGLAPIWAIGFPICLLAASRVSSVKPEDHQIKPKYLLQFYMMLVFLMMTANIAGTIFISIIEHVTGLTIENATIDMIQKQEFLPSLIFTVILGPILEELAYRKLLIDKLGQYNKRYAIILSGVMFGLFHTNLHQFFYATIIGFLFAYIYTISGRVRYTMILHMTFNFIHGILPMAIVKNLDLDSLSAISEGDVMNPEVQKQVFELYTNPAFLGLLGYGLLIIGLWIAGLVLWIINHKKIKVDDSNSPLPLKEGKYIPFINVGMILFTVLTIAITVLEIILLNIK